MISFIIITPMLSCENIPHVGVETYTFSKFNCFLRNARPKNRAPVPPRACIPSH
jgi:hypothetical protein